MVARQFRSALREIADSLHGAHGDLRKAGTARYFRSGNFPEGPAVHKLAKILTNYGSTATGEIANRACVRAKARNVFIEILQTELNCDGHYTAQSSHRRPSTRRNSRTLAVTRVNPRRNA